MAKRYRIKLNDCTGAVLGEVMASSPEEAISAALREPGILKQIRRTGYADCGSVRWSGDPGLSGIFQITASLKRCKEYGAARHIITRVHVGAA